jgi:hypothetical protein
MGKEKHWTGNCLLGIYNYFAERLIEKIIARDGSRLVDRDLSWFNSS